MMHQFNKTIDYLESTFTSEVDFKKFQNISGYSYPLFSRIFSILSEITLAEYLRNRKLTLAIDDLLLSKSFMGIHPQKFEKGKTISYFLKWN